MKKVLQIVPVLTLALLMLCSCGQKKQNRTKIELSGPKDLVTEIYGIKKTGNVFYLSPGEYVLGFSAPGYRSDWQKVSVPKGSLKYKVELAPVTTAALITSEPAGATVTMDGKNLGITPLVIRDLKTGEYTADLAMAGYAGMPVAWKITDSHPVSAHGVLVSNQGTLNITSVPVEAQVFVDGTPVGKTPLKLQRPEGRYLLRLERAGCTPEERSVTIYKGRTDSIKVALARKPGGVSVSSIPAGAEVLINGVKQGVTPCTVQNLQPGRYTVLVRRDGYDPVEKTVQIAAAAVDKLHVDLSSSSGSVVFNVLPAGVEVFLDGKPLGTAKPLVAGSESTADFRVENLAPGKHKITLFHTLGDPPRQEFFFEVRKNKCTTLRDPLVVWIANCEITYQDNSKRRGFLVERRKNLIIFSPEPGVRFGIELPQIKKIIMLKGVKNTREK